MIPDWLQHGETIALVPINGVHIGVGEEDLIATDSPFIYPRVASPLGIAVELVTTEEDGSNLLVLGQTVEGMAGKVKRIACVDVRHLALLQLERLGYADWFLFLDVWTAHRDPTVHSSLWQTSLDTFANPLGVPGSVKARPNESYLAWLVETGYAG